MFVDTGIFFGRGKMRKQFLQLWKPWVLIGFFSGLCMWVSFLPKVSALAISPLIIAIVLGIFLGNSVRKYFPKSWDTVITFGAKKVLRAGIVLYGLKISLMDILGLGITGFLVAVFMVFSTFFVVYGFHKVFGKQENDDLAILVGAGASVCGAAAVMAAQETTKSNTEKTSVAVATVVVFGTLSMFLLPLLFSLGIFSLPDWGLGIFIGATVHEVAQVVAVGNFFSPEIADSAVIAKMTRVVLLVGLLFVIGFLVSTPNPSSAPAKDVGIRYYFLNAVTSLPLFVLLFLGVVMLNTFITLPSTIYFSLLLFDTFLLTIAMFCLGLETRVSAFKKVGGYAFGLAGVAFVWLVFVGYGVVRVML